MLVRMGVCFLTPKARPTTTPGTGYGSVTSEPIAAGEVVAAFGGRCVTRDEFDLLPTEPADPQHADRRASVHGRRTRTRARRLHQPLVRSQLRPERQRAAGRRSRHRRRRGVDVRLRHQRRQRLRRVRVRLRHCCVPRQGHRPRLDAAGTAVALPRVVQPVPGQAHRRAGRPSAPSAAPSPCKPPASPRSRSPDGRTTLGPCEC